jgi:hypothetical protein
VTKGFDEAGLVIFTSPLPELPVEIKEAGLAGVATPDLGELFYRPGGEEIVGVEIVGEEKRLFAEGL